MGPDETPAAAAGSMALGDGLTVNRMGFGAMRLTGPGIWGEPGDAGAARRVLERALDLGVTFIDTADSYGPEVSERLIHEALHPYPDDLVIGTKGGQVRPGPGQWVPDGRPEHLRRALEGSLERLGIEQIDLYQLHRPDPKVPFEESLGTLINLRNEGKIRCIGVSNVTEEQLLTALRMTAVVSVQNRYNLSDRHSEGVLELCDEHGLAFIPWAPLALHDVGQLGGTLDAIAQAHDATVGQVVLAWLLARSPRMLPIPGTASVHHLEQNVAAAALQLAPEEMQELESL